MEGVDFVGDFLDVVDVFDEVLHEVHFLPLVLDFVFDFPEDVDLGQKFVPEEKELDFGEPGLAGALLELDDLQKERNNERRLLLVVPEALELFNDLDGVLLVQLQFEEVYEGDEAYGNEEESPNADQEAEELPSHSRRVVVSVADCRHSHSHEPKGVNVVDENVGFISDARSKLADA